MTQAAKIPFKVDIKRMLDLLAKQIYQSPLALLRENCQNAYDAVLQRIGLGHQFEPCIVVEINRNRIAVTDNGIGMTREELDKNFWTAGSSGKNTPEARAAGVVGTFGIGAMANFGIAEALEVQTQSARNGQKTLSRVQKSQLSATENCIEIESLPQDSEPGTMVQATMPDTAPVDVAQAEAYIKEFVKYLSIPVLINRQLSSKTEFVTALPKFADAETNNKAGATIAGNLVADIETAFANSGEVWIRLTNIQYAGHPIAGELLLKQGFSRIQTFRSRFALAGVAVSSTYNFGGFANLSNLEPTAGREALTTESMNFLQHVISGVEEYVSLLIATTDAADKNTGFMNWVSQHSRYELCARLSIQLMPSEETLPLEVLRDKSKSVEFNYYEGSDKAIRDSYATEEKPVVVPSSSNPRRQCQAQYIRKFCRVAHVSDAPQVLKVRSESEHTFAEMAFAFRIVEILETDYFVNSEVRFGKMTHGLPMLVDTTSGIRITFDSESGTIQTILQLYDREFLVFTSMVKDFVRTSIFPKIASFVPSSTREGAEAFLNAVRRPREYFEYEMAEADALKDIIGNYLDGNLSFRDAATQAAQTAQVNYQVVEATSTGAASGVIGDVVDNVRKIAPAEGEEELGPLPAIPRLDRESPIKLLTIEDSEEPLKKYRCFIAVTDRIRREHTDFFLQPHRTEIVWGGQKALYVFQHHSGTFALYYELQGNELLAAGSGGRSFPTCTIAIKNQIYIPVPDEIRQKFIPAVGSRKRFAVRSDLLFPDR